MATSRVLESGTKVPSIDPLVRVILTWDFYRDVADDRRSTTESEAAIIARSVAAAEASASKSAQNAGIPQTEAQTVVFDVLPQNFSSEEDYMNRMYALFLLETKQSAHRAKEMEMDHPEIVIQLAAESRNGYIILTLQRAENFSVAYYTSDLCLLYLDEPNSYAGLAPLEDPLTATCLDPKTDNVYHTLAVVESSLRNILTMKVFIPTISSTDERSFTRLTNIAKAISSHGKRWYCVKVMGLSTITREYQALMSFPDMLLKDDLLLSGNDPIIEANAKLRIIEERIMNLPSDNKKKDNLKRLMAQRRKFQKRLETLKQRAEYSIKDTLEVSTTLVKKLETLYNNSQLDALKDCLKASGVTLIQGPPGKLKSYPSFLGTGKTTTIVGVLSVILNASVKTSKKTNKQPSTAAPSPTNSDEDVVMNQQFQADYAAIRRAQPWIYNADYQPWYDEVSLLTEDLEKHIYKEAPETDVVLELAHVELEAQPRRVLVCAPSNAAIDEILKRLTADPTTGGGVLDATGERYTPAVVRVGPNIHPQLVSFSLEARTNSRLQAMGGAMPSGARESVKMGILSESRIVCSTLSICGSKEFIAFPDSFDTVVVDEASQGVELSTLIPLRLGCRRLILVGDPKQLPATVFSKVAISQNYDQSLFQRLERAGHHVNLLSEQYRMHPAIAEFPSLTFYDGQLLNGPGIENFVKPPIPWYTIPLFKPIVFYAVESEEQSESTSLINTEEAMFICQLIDLLKLMFSSIPSLEDIWHQKVAVISPYAEQVRLIRKLIKALLQIGSGQPCPIDVNTVDGFQGREKDLIIFSAVRAQKVNDDVTESERRANVGFLADTRRMNVALTRARYNLWVVGNGRYLVGNPEWGKFWNYTAKKDYQFNVNYHTVPKSGYLKRWLHEYFIRVPAARLLLMEHVPRFIEGLDRDVKLLKQADNATLAVTENTERTLLEVMQRNTPESSGGMKINDEGDFDDALVQE